MTFINNDNRPHEIASNPHPQHGTCPSIEGGLGSLAAGQTKTTRAFANAGSCGFHDHLDDTNAKPARHDQRAVADYVPPVNFGLRFSRKAAVPSSLSSDA